MSQAVGRMYHPASPIRRAGDIPHVHPANAHRYHNNYNNAVQVYTVTTRNHSPSPHRPYHNGGGYGGPPPSPPHRGRRGRYPPNSYYNGPQQGYQHPHHHQQQQQPQQQPYRHPYNHLGQQKQQPQYQQQRQSSPLPRQPSPLLQRQSSPLPHQTSPSLHHSNHSLHHSNHNHNGGPPYYHPNQNQSYPQRSSRTSGFFDELEWDSSDGVGQLGADKKGQRRRGDREGAPQGRGGQNGLKASDFDLDLEWDDYDLKPKIEETDDGVELVLPENYLPLLKASQKATLSKGQVPISAIQVKRLPNRTCLSAKTRGFNKDLLVLTSDFQGLEGLGDADAETKELLEDALIGEHCDDEFLIAQNNNGPDIYKLGNGFAADIPRGRYEGSVTDSDSIRDRSQDLTDSDEQSTYDFIDDEYELPSCHDRLADVNLYALSPHDFDTPDSICSRSLADLTDLSLYEEFGVETIRRRRALLSTDKEGRDSLLKDATRKLSLKAKKRKRKTSDKLGDGAVIGAGDDGSEIGRQKRVAPNYFVAIQVSNPEIHKALHEVQHTVMTGDEKLKDAMVPIPTLHLTIMVMHLANDEDVERAKLALMECHQLLGTQISDKKLNIWFHGLGHFNNQVMFAKIKDMDGIIDTLYNIAETVENCYRRHGIYSTGERGFKPHLTVMKLSRAPSLRKKGVRRIKSELYRAHSAMLFGNQPVTGFQLCSINKPKTEDGYYFKAHEIFFGVAPSVNPEPSDSETVDEASKEPIAELDSSGIGQSEEELSNQQEVSTKPCDTSTIEEAPKEPITELDTSGVRQSDGESANQQQEESKEEAKETTATVSQETSPPSNTEGSKPSEVEPT